MIRFVPLLIIGVLTACTVERTGQDAPADTTDSVGASAETTYTVDSVIVPSPARPPSPRTAGAAARLLPVDQADEAPDFFAYRRRLIEAVSARDASALYEMMSEDIHISFGGERGLEGFRETWRPSSDDSEVWATLGRVLAGGGLYEEGPFDLGGSTATARFTAPYTFAAFPGAEFDAFQHGVIVDAAVPVRIAPRADAATVDTLSFAIVRVPSFPPPEEEWTRVELSHRQPGYVRSASVASPVDYRALFHRINGKWRLTAFLAGD